MHKHADQTGGETLSVWSNGQPRPDGATGSLPPSPSTDWTLRVTLFMG